MADAVEAPRSRARARDRRAPARGDGPPAPSVSVIVPAYQAADTLDACLASVHAQRFQRWEAVIVDDGSTDRTGAIATAWVARDPRFRLLPRRRNRGVSAARNAGLAAARGPYVLFLDADDWIGPDHLQVLVDALESDGSAVAAYGGNTPVDIDGEVAPAELPPPPDELFAYTARACPVAIHACLVRRDVVTELGGFDTRLAVAEDWDLWQRLARSGARQVRVAASEAHYQARPGSATRRECTALAACLEIVRRGHGPDPRVPAPAPEHAAGRPAEELPGAATLTVVWGVGLTAGSGGDPVGLLEGLALPPLAKLPPAELAGSLLHGLATGRGTRTERLADHWTGLRSACRPALCVLGSTLHDAGWAARLLERADRHLAAAQRCAGPPVRVGAVEVHRIDLAHPLPALRPADDVTVLQVRAELAGQRVGEVEVPAQPGADHAPAVAQAIREQCGGAWMRSWLRHAVRQRPSAVLRVGRKLVTNADARRLVADLARRPLRDARDRLAAWLAQRPRLALPPDLLPPPAPADPADTRHPPAASAWDAVFAEPDPWGYDSAYERVKYEHTLELLPAGPIGRALELACAEGHFTERLAPRVGALVATDISAIALERARRRCAAYGNLSWRQLDLRRDKLPGPFDLIVCSEVLYFLRDRFELARIGRRLAAALTPGGHLLTAHAKVVADQPTEAGFDWCVGFGARRIGRTFARLGALELVRELETELYVVQLFRRRATHPVARPAPERLRRAPAPPAKPEVLSWVARPPLRTSQTDLLGLVRTDRLPILMYHRIAADGPPALAPYRLQPERFLAQLAWLKGEGYRSVTLAVWRWALRERHGVLPGKAVVLTFDDAYRDFADVAWPLLREHGFGATLFVVSERVGGRAEWDAPYGEPAPLLGWDELRRLAGEGVEIGAHSATHPYLTQLTAAEARAELTGSRARLEAELGRPVTALAYPFGDEDGLVRRIAGEAGFELAVTTSPGLARLGDDPMGVPRQEVRGEGTLADLAAKLGTPRMVGRDQRLRHRLDRWLGRTPAW